MEKLEFQGMSAGSVYKLVFTGLVFGIMAMFGMKTLIWNQQSVTGISALFIGPLTGLFMALIFTAFMGSVMAVGLWLFSKFQPGEIFVIPVAKKTLVDE
jgi:hypothetical protein